MQVVIENCGKGRNHLKIKVSRIECFPSFPAEARVAKTMLLALALVLCGGRDATAENCQTSTDMDAATRSAITATGQRYFDMVAKGDAGSLRQNAIPSVASDFSGIEATVKSHQPDLAGAHATARAPFLLEAEGAAPIAHAEFFCGIFGKSGQTPTSAVFYLNNLPPGKYAAVILDGSAKVPTAVSFILQQVGNDWKLGGLYIKALQSVGHDSDWFTARAREYKAKGQMHNAWLYFLMARSLVSPLPFMSTAVTDKLYDESQSLLPADIPAEGKTVDFQAGTTTYKLVSMYPDAMGNDLDLLVRYQVNDISNTNQTYQSNVALMKGLVTKYPEFKEAFAGINARAVDPGGRDYGTLLAMKDVK
jgi:hypothetical protein